MKKREDIVQKFSTFLCFGDDRNKNTQWQTDVELERHIKTLVESDPEAKEEFWARYFLRASDTSTPKHSQHLCAYLQEACLWAAQRTYQRFRVMRHKYDLQEYFQIAYLAANPPLKLLKNFNFDYPDTKIESYAKTAIIRSVSNIIYHQDLEARRDKFSDYGLLKDITGKELREALTARAFNQEKINRYYLIWKAFDEIYQPKHSQGSRCIVPPNSEQIQQIAAHYNQHLHPATAIGDEEIQEVLLICIAATREQRTKRCVPLEDYENISDPSKNTWEKLIQQEILQQVESIVLRLFSNLPQNGQTLLKLWLGLNLTQTEIAAVLKNQYPEFQKQYQVARHLSRYTRSLLKDLVSELQTIHEEITPDICLNNETNLAVIKGYLDECLQNYLQNFFDAILAKLNNRHMAITTSVEYNLSQEIKKLLLEGFQNELKVDMSLSDESLELAHLKMADFVDEWFFERQLQVNVRSEKI